MELGLRLSLKRGSFLAGRGKREFWDKAHILMNHMSVGLD